MSVLAIDEGKFVTINNVSQWLVIRGRSLSNPALLIVSGPGVALSAMAPHFADWEQHYTLVHWDQPGAGATQSRITQAQQPLQLSRLVADGVAVVEYVRQRLGLDKISVLGISAGSIVALRMMHECPHYFAAYVGTGQFVNWARQDTLSYEQLLASATAKGDAEAIQELTAIGPPPYANSSVDVIKSKYHSALTPAEMAEFPAIAALMGAALTNPPAQANYLAQGVALQNPGMLATQAYEAVRLELLEFDAWSLPRDYSMPVLFIQGAQDLYSITSEVQRYEEYINAPVKKTVLIDEGGHGVIWLQRQFLQQLNKHLLDTGLLD